MMWELHFYAILMILVKLWQLYKENKLPKSLNSITKYTIHGKRGNTKAEKKQS